MKPYYERGGVTIYHGDCRDVLPGLAFDAVLTDPPYGLGDLWNGGGGSAGSSWRFDPAEAKSWDAASVDGLVQLVSSAAPEVVIWGGNYYPLPPSRGWLVWDKKQNDSFTTGQAELAWTNLNRTTRVFRFAQCELATEGPKLHPTQKPLALMRWCLKWLSGSVIVDPFAGSGTTLRAAMDIGLSAIGIEIEERYCEIAASRLAQGVLGLAIP